MSDSNIPIITIDGPSGTGKGALCGYLTQQLDWHLLDSGAIYRVLAYAASQQGVAVDSEDKLAILAADMSLHFSFDSKHNMVQVSLDGKDVSTLIRTEACASNASRVAALPQVRHALLEKQRGFCRMPGLLADGRDMGTVVFPQAQLKIFLTASADARAERRYKQLIDRGVNANLRHLCREINERDERDKHRLVSPLKPAEDAVVLDTTTMSITAVNEQVMGMVNKTFPDNKLN